MLTIDEYLAEFKRIGLLEHLSAGEMAALEVNAHALDASSPLLPLLILEQAPGTIFTVRGWRQAGDNAAPADYEALAGQMAAITQGRFALGNIQGDMVREHPDYEPEDVLRDAIRVRFELEGQSREHVAFLSPHTKSNFVNIPRLVDAVNRALVETGRDERFYWADSPANDGPPMGYGLIVLTTHQQRDVTQARLLNFDPDQAFTWTPAHMEEYIREYHDLGLLDHLSSEACDRVEQAIRAEQRRWLSALRAYPGAVCFFDAECIYEPARDYTELIPEIAAVAHGDFMVTDIQIEDPQKRGDQFRIDFSVDGRAFTCQQTYTGDWVQWEFLEAMNRAAADLDRKGRFMLLITGTQEAMVAYLTEAQVRGVRESAVLRLDDYIKWV